MQPSRLFRFFGVLILPLVLTLAGFGYIPAHAQTVGDPMAPTQNIGCLEHGPVFTATTGVNIAIKSEDKTDVTFLHIINHEDPKWSYYSIARASVLNSVKIDRPEESARGQYSNCYSHKPEVVRFPPVPERLLRREVVDRMRRDPEAIYSARPYTLLANGYEYGDVFPDICVLSNDTEVSVPGAPTPTPVPAVISSRYSTLVRWGMPGSYKITVIDAGITPLDVGRMQGGLYTRSLECGKDAVLEILVGMTQKGAYTYVDPENVIIGNTRPLPTPRPTQRVLNNKTYLPAAIQTSAR